MSGIGLLEFYQDSGTVTKANVKASAGRVRAIRFTNANAAARFVQIHNKATAPAATETANLYFLIPAGTAAAPGILDLEAPFFGDPGRYLSTGIGYAISTTATTFTDAATAADHTVAIVYS